MGYVDISTVYTICMKFSSHVFPYLFIRANLALAALNDEVYKTAVGYWLISYSQQSLQDIFLILIFDFWINN